MQCSQCGQRQRITINNKNYCTKCGYTTVPKNVLDLQAKTESVPAAAPAVRGGNVLDLSAQLPKKTDVASINGVRVVPAARRAGELHSQPQRAGRPKAVIAPAPPIKSAATTSAPSLSGQPPKTREQRATQIMRSQHIAKFAQKQVVSRQPAESEPTAQSIMPELPVVQVPAHYKHDPAAEIAKHHERAPQFQMPAAPTLAEEDTKSKRSSKRRLSLRPRLSSATAIALTVFVLGGYITYLNLPNITLRVAAAKAGFSARMPRHTPTGYDFSGPVTYAPGQITVSFRSDEGGNFSITQRQTDLDSESLLENQILPKTDRYLTFYEKGLTIYVYNGNQAAWVNRGVLYQIEGQNLLNSEQIVRIASSL